MPDANGRIGDSLSPFILVLVMNRSLVLWKHLFLVSLVLLSFSYHVEGESALQLGESDFDKVLAENEVVFVNFYADWCKFSNMLEPIWEEAAEKIAKEVAPYGKAAIGKVDCDKESNIARRYHISKYPTLKLVKFGQLVKREYRGQRSAEAFATFIQEQLQDPVKSFSASDGVKTEEKKRSMIAYVTSKEKEDYNNFRKVAMILKDDCDFFATDDPTPLRPSAESLIVFRPPFSSGDSDEPYAGNKEELQDLLNWATDHCTPLVREITFENAEELTEEGLPFVILFHHPDDVESVKRFNKLVQNHLRGEKDRVTFLTADGLKFSHPLHHLGKSKDQLPLIALDSFRHMYLYPHMNDIDDPEKMKQFLEDMYSGKLHREFHYGPDPAPSSDSSKNTDVTGRPHPKEQETGEAKVPTTPPESTFKKLAPSRNRYTLLRDEL